MGLIRSRERRTTSELNLSGLTHPLSPRYASACGGAALRTDEKNPKGDRGVLFNPQLPDGEFRQYGMLPLRLWAAVPGRSGDEQ